MLRDDKSFPYIELLQPRVSAPVAVSRHAQSRSAATSVRIPNVWAVRGSLQQLQKLFQLRNCRDSFFANRTRPCLQHQIGRCSAPCVGLIDSGRLRTRCRCCRHGAGRPGQRSDAHARSADAARRPRALDFERAARCAISWATLRKVQAEQAVGGRRGPGCRCVRDRGRAGRIRGRAAAGAGRTQSRHDQLFSARAGHAEEVLASFLLQHYAREEVPGEIFVESGAAGSRGLW